VPYLHCQNCRLTLYKGRGSDTVGRTCPRCAGPLDRAPASFFDKASRLGRSPGGAVPRSGWRRQPAAPPLHGKRRPGSLRDAPG
jgi:hypothetical protein